MKKKIIVLLILLGSQWAFAQSSATEQQIKELSKAKWQWMADKKVDKLALLFHDQSKFVHMTPIRLSINKIIFDSGTKEIYQ